MKAVRFHEFGGTEVLRVDELSDPAPGPDEAVLAVTACAVNHVDMDIRAGVSGYPVSLPHTLGFEVAGRVASLPSAYTGTLRVGDRAVASVVPACGNCEACRQGRDNHCSAARLPGIHRAGGYATHLIYGAAHLIPLPPGCSDVDAAAAQLSCGTAWHMLVDRGRIQPGEWALIDAVGSGVGSAALQIARLWGARVIGCSHSKAKLAEAAAAGCDVTVHLGQQDLVQAVQRATGGQGAHLSVNCVGGDLFSKLVQATAPGGRVLVVGGHGGEQPPLDLIDLFRREVSIIGSKRATAANLGTVFNLVASGLLRPRVAEVLPLEQAAEAHRLLEARAVYGKLVLVPA